VNSAGSFEEAREEAAERARWMASCLGEVVAASPIHHAQIKCYFSEEV